MSKSRNSHPKRRVESSNHERSITQPLDLRSSNEEASIEVPDIDERFVEPRRFVQYKPLCTFIDFGELNEATSDDSVTKEEWDQRMEYLLDDLHWLLKLPHNKFWSQILYDDTLHHCLDSFLAYAPRDFDLSSCTEKDVLVTSQRVHKLIFFVFLRMSTYKESKKSGLSPEAFGEMIYENYLFDIPKILDLCGLYGSKNGTILKKMIFNIFNTQPKYISDLETAVPHLFMAFGRVLGKLHLSQGNEEMVPAKLDEDISLGISRIPLSALLDVVYYITDTAYAVNAFIEIYPQSCHVYYRNEAATRVATFYDTVFPPIENELQTRENEETKTILEKYKSMVQLAKTLLLKIFRNFITTCCLQLIVESQCSKTGGMEELAFSHLEEYMCIFTEVVAHRHFIHDYNNMFPFENDIEMISEIGLSFDPTRLDYIFSSIHQYSDAVCNGGLSLANKLSEESRKSYRHSRRKQNDVKDLQSLAATLTNGTLSSKNSEADLLSYEAAAASGIDEAELESLIAAVLDVLPGFGAGFIEACLKYYSFDSERVIDVLLQDSLAESLQTLDRGLQRIPVPKEEQTPSLLSERRNVYDNDEFDIFNRKDVDMQRIHLGKKNKTPDVYQGLSDDKSGISDILKQISLCAATSQEEEEEASFPKEPDLYEDEYDDTYDSTTVGLMELQTEKELQNIRPFTTPRVLEQIKGSPQNIKDDDVEEEEEEEEEQPPPPKKDEFVANPAVLREMAEQRRQSQARNRRPHNPRENSQGQGAQGGGQQHNRHHKEKHKGQIANHNRRRQADNKRSRGMGALPTR